MAMAHWMVNSAEVPCQEELLESHLQGCQGEPSQEGSEPQNSLQSHQRGAGGSHMCRGVTLLELTGKLHFGASGEAVCGEVLDHKSLLEQEEIPLPPLVSLQCPVIKSNNMAAGKGAMFQHHKQGNNGWVWSRKATDL